MIVSLLLLSYFITMGYYYLLVLDYSALAAPKTTDALTPSNRCLTRTFINRSYLSLLNLLHWLYIYIYHILNV